MAGPGHALGGRCIGGLARAWLVAEGGTAVKWTDYPSRADYAARCDGTERQGDYLSPGPGPGQKWVLAPGGKYALVRVRMNEAYRIMTEREAGDTYE